MILRILIAVAIVAAAFLGGCSTAGHESSADASIAQTSETTPITSETLSRITGTTWVLQSLVSDGAAVELLDHRPTIRFEADGRVSGGATLNRYFGTMQIAPSGQVSWSDPLGMTRMAGPEDLMRQEDVFIKTLPKIVSLSVTQVRRAMNAAGAGVQPVMQDQLTARSDDGQVVMVFDPAAPQAPAGSR